MLRDVYSNTKDTGFTSNFFDLASLNPKQALLASPFYTTFDPIETLTKKGCEVALIIRVCEATDVRALRDALRDPLVTVRFYTDRQFHPKLYIIDDSAMVGSANLTRSGLQSNREVSVVLHRGRDLAFESLPGIFDDLWDYADVLTDDIVDAFEKIKKNISSAKINQEFDQALSASIKPVKPRSIIVGSDEVSRERSFLQSFKRKYDEVLIPDHNEIMEVAKASKFGRPEYVGQDPQIEMGRFLGWVRLVHGPGDDWKNTSLLSVTEREKHIATYVSEWQSTSDTVARDMYDSEKEIQNISYIQSSFQSVETIDNLSYDEVFDALIGCHAFLEQLRFTKGGLDGLRNDFGKRNSLPKIKSTLVFLLHGRGDAIQRAYDTLYNPRYRLERFGEASVMELLGWHSKERPPFNNRTIRGMRFLGFDVEQRVAGA